MNNILEYIESRLEPVKADIEILSQGMKGAQDDEDITSRKYALNVAYAIRATLIEIKLAIVEEMHREESRYEG